MTNIVNKLSLSWVVNQIGQIKIKQLHSKRKDEGFSFLSEVVVTVWAGMMVCACVCIGNTKLKRYQQQNGG